MELFGLRQSAAVMCKALKSLLIDAEETYSYEEDTIYVENVLNLLDNLLDGIEES